MTTKELKKLEDQLWDTANNLRANSDLSSSEYSQPVLGLIFLKFADNQYSRFESEIIKEFETSKSSRSAKSIDRIAIGKCGLYLPDKARYNYLLNLPTKEDIAKAIKEAMEAIEEYIPELQGVLPKNEYSKLTRTDNEIPKELLRNFSNIPKDASGDVLGQIYEFFLGKFALAEGQGGGEFFTPKSVVKLMVEIIEPHRGTVYDPACGSGGMFVQSARFIAEHNKDNRRDFFVHGQEKNQITVNLAKMNMAVNHLRASIRQANTYIEDLPEGSFGKFDYVLANPPFNVSDVNLNSVEGQKRFNTYGIPRNKTKAKKKDVGKETVPNANYLWISLFATSLKEKGRAALVMANSASDARHSEAEIREKLIKEKLIYGMLTLPSNMFYTVTLPATLWFFEKGRADNRILFIDARNVFSQIDRAHREFLDEQIQNLSLISRLHRGKNEEYISTIHNYFIQAFEEKDALKQAVEKNDKLFSEFIESFAIWLKQPTVKDAFIEFSKEESTVTSAVNSNSTHYKSFSDLLELHSSLKIPSIKTAINLLDDFESRFNSYGKTLDLKQVTATNKEQLKLYKNFDKTESELTSLHKSFEKLLAHIEELYSFSDKNLKTKEDKLWKNITSLKELRYSLEEFHDRISPYFLRDSNHLEKSFVYFFQNINWLQSRFPNAAYEDVIGLCKLASMDEVKEQDYSLNPGRYVGVVIENDGKTVEEFYSELKGENDLLQVLEKEAEVLNNVIQSNISMLLNYE